MFPVEALHEKGVKIDLLSNPPVLREGNDTFPISTGVARMFLLHILLDGQEEPHHISHTAVGRDTWPRRMDPCRPRALKQPAAELTTRANDIDSSGAGAPSSIGQKPDDSRTYETVDLGTAKSVLGTGIDPNFYRRNIYVDTGNNYRDGARNAWNPR